MPKRHSDKRSTEATLEWRPVESVIPYARNPRLISETAISKVAGSIAEFGFRQPIVVDGEGVVIVGHTRLYAAQRLGLETVPVLVAADLSPAQVKAYRIADNRTAQEAEWDLSLLSLEFEDLAAFDFDVSLTGFDPSELVFGDEASDIVEDEAPEPPEEPVTKPGDLWVLGEHRVLCGDATVATDAERVLSGATPLLMVTDPPYGVEYDPTWRDGKRGRWGPTVMRSTVRNDDRTGWADAWSLFPGDVGSVWHASLHTAEVLADLESCGFGHRAQIVWRKQHPPMSRGHYHWQHEPCWYAVRNGATAHWCGDRKQSTVWDVANLNPTGNREEARTGHGTQKPVEVMARPIRNHEGDVYDAPAPQWSPARTSTANAWESKSPRNIAPSFYSA